MLYLIKALINQSAYLNQLANPNHESCANSFPSQNAASQPQLLHKELVRKRKVMISELYQAVEKGDMDNLVDAMQRVCDGR